MTRPDIFKKFETIRSIHDRLMDATGMDPLGVRIENFTSPTEASVNGRSCILMGSNNYLGLTFDPASIDAACLALKTSGTGTTGSRVANGSYGPHQDLERQIADFYDRKSAILFTTGYQANVGFLSAICGKNDYIVIDSESHASIYDGCKLGQATTLIFRHNDVEDLDKRLARLPTDAVVLVVTEGIFSMRGDRAPLRAIVATAKKYNAYVMVDEAHSLGIVGKTGRGMAEEDGVEADVDFILGTFSKSVGTIGGFCVSNHEQLDTVRFAARAYLFTASLPPSIVASAARTLERIRTDVSLRVKLQENSTIMHNGLKELGYEIGAKDPVPQPSQDSTIASIGKKSPMDRTPVIGIMMPSLDEGLRIWRALMDSGVYLNLILPPAAPEGRCLLRCSVSAAHTKEQLAKVLEVFAHVRKIDTLAAE